MIVDRGDARNGFSCNADRSLLIGGFCITPDVDNSVGYRHAQIVGVRSRFLLQFVEQLLSDRRIRKSHF